jgi:hypothetical protein
LGQPHDGMNPAGSPSSSSPRWIRRRTPVTPHQPLGGTEAAAAQDGHLSPLPFLVSLAGRLRLSHRERPKPPPARHLPDQPFRLQFPEQCSRGLRRDPEFCRERIRCQRWIAQQSLDRARQPRSFVGPGGERPALLCRGVEPVEFAQTHPRALGHEMKEGERQVMGTPQSTRRSAASLRRVGSAARSPKPTAG